MRVAVIESSGISKEALRGSQPVRPAEVYRVKAVPQEDVQELSGQGPNFGPSSAVRRSRRLVVRSRAPLKEWRATGPERNQAEPSWEARALLPPPRCLNHRVAEAPTATRAARC